MRLSFLVFASHALEVIHNYMKKFSVLMFLSVTLFSFGGSVYAQSELVPEKQVTVKAQVLDVLDQEIKNIPGLDTQTNYQTIRIKVLEGEEIGKVVTIQNDYLNLEVGEVFYLTHTTNSVDGTDAYAVSDPYRLPALYFFIGLFVLIVFLFGGIQGIRGLAALCISLLLILYVLFPAVLHGYSPILVSIAVSSFVIIVGSYITHGFNKTTSAAVVGMVLTIIITGALAYVAVQKTRLSGFSTEESVYLNLNTGGHLDFAGLLLGGIIIGLLGVLYDAAIGQAVAVEELHQVAPHLGKKVIFKRAQRIGREHIGALVNTLAIAYVGASLPLLLLFYNSPTKDIGLTINREIFATEIVRTMVGSIGLVLAVPITTIIAVLWLVRPLSKKQIDNTKIETEEIEKLQNIH